MSGVVKVVVGDLGSFNDEDTIPIENIAKAIAAIPEEHLAKAVLAIEVFGDYASASISINYTRPETDGKRQKRERDERERLAKYDRDRHEREHAEFLRLKAKFEP